MDTSASDPMYEKVDSLVRDGTLTPAQASTVFERVRGGAGATSVVAADADRRRWSLPVRGAGAAAGAGAGILLGALLVANELAEREDFNWYAFLVALIGAIGLCAVGAALALLGRDADHRRWLASLVLAAGIFAAVNALDIVLQSKDWANYVNGVVMVAAGLAAYLWLRGAALTAVVVFGGLVLLSEIVDDITGDDGDSLIGPGLAVTAYGLVVIAAGWRLASRHVTGMLGGAIALFGMLLVVFFGGLFAFFAGFGLDSTGGDPGREELNDDIWIALIVGLLVCLALAGLYAYSDYVGYLVLAFLGASLLTATALSIVLTDNRLWFAAIFGAVGGLLVAAAALRELMSRRREGGRRVASQPAAGPAHDYSTGQYGQAPYGQPPAYGQAPTVPSQQQYPPPPPPHGGPPPPA